MDNQTDKWAGQIENPSKISGMTICLVPALFAMNGSILMMDRSILKSQGRSSVRGCADEIEKKKERYGEIKDLLSQISDAEYSIKDAKRRLEQLNYDPETDTANDWY
jgi:hypothetical protein